MQNLQYAKTSLVKNEFLSTLITELQDKNWANAAVLFGSIPRGDDNYHSDIDVAIWINQEMTNKEVLENIVAISSLQVEEAFFLPRKRSVILYDKNMKKSDVLIIRNKEELNKNYLGSNIPANRIKDSVLFDKTNTLVHYLESISSNYSENINTQELTKNFIKQFMFWFDNFSKHHARSDAQRFYYNYNNALHSWVKLQYLAQGNTTYTYSPRFFLKTGWDGESRSILTDLESTFDLAQGNIKKRLLLDQFYRTVNQICPEKLDRCKTFCEKIYERDYFWNFRDYTIHVGNISQGKIFRSAGLAIYEDKKALSKLEKHHITTVIDLRSEKECKEVAYTSQFLDEIEYIQAAFDPWNQPDWFTQLPLHQELDARSIAYLFFLCACQKSFAQAIDAILNATSAVLIHCHAGKDRTGLLIGAIQMLLGQDRKDMEKDYLASGLDADVKMFQYLFQEVERQGGITAFFEYQGVSKEKQEVLKRKLLT